MRIDATHKPWAIGTMWATAAAIVLFVLEAHLSAGSPKGGSVLGLTFGISGLLLMLFAGLLSVRKKFPVWRIGRSQTWMRGHLWLGALSYVLILFHCAFSARGSLAAVLFWLFTLVVLSGFVGAAIQHYLPRLMTQRVPYETIYYDIDRIQRQLLEESDQLVASVEQVAARKGLLVTASAGTLSTGGHQATSEQALTHFKEAYEESVRAFLAERGSYDHPLYVRSTAKNVFSRLRRLIPEELTELVDDVENICEEKRDLDRQSRIHRVLHGWLFVHVPLSYAVIAMSIVHAVLALRY